MSCLFEESNSSEIREMELMLLPAQDLPVGTSMIMGIHGLTTGKMMMLTICFDRITMRFTDTMMLTMILKYNVVIYPADVKWKRPSGKNDTHTDHLITCRKK